MINVSPIGRNCTQEERIAFFEYDKVSGVFNTVPHCKGITENMCNLSQTYHRVLLALAVKKKGFGTCIEHNKVIFWHGKFTFDIKSGVPAPCMCS